jgi:hypothetical protein
MARQPGRRVKRASSMAASSRRTAKEGYRSCLPIIPVLGERFFSFSSLNGLRQ